MLPSAPMLLLLTLLSAADAQSAGELALVEDTGAAEEELTDRRIGEPMFLLAYVLLAGLGVVTTLRTREAE